MPSASLPSTEGTLHLTKVEARTAQRRRADWAGFVRDLLEGRYREAERVILVMDQLNTHALASLYEAFPPAQARRLAERIELHHTPKHGSWLNMAEIELAALGPLVPSPAHRPPRHAVPAAGRLGLPRFDGHR